MSTIPQSEMDIISKDEQKTINEIPVTGVIIFICEERFTGSGVSKRNIKFKPEHGDAYYVTAMGSMSKAMESYDRMDRVRITAFDRAQPNLEGANNKILKTIEKA